MALKSRIYILDLDHVKLSLEIFFFLAVYRRAYYTSFQDLPFFLSRKHTHQKTKKNYLDHAKLSLRIFFFILNSYMES